jgi:hypothetical protein
MITALVVMQACGLFGRQQCDGSSAYLIDPQRERFACKEV